MQSFGSTSCVLFHVSYQKHDLLIPESLGITA